MKQIERREERGGWIERERKGDRNMNRVREEEIYRLRERYSAVYNSEREGKRETEGKRERDIYKQ